MRHWTEDEKRKVLEMRLRGLTAGQVARKFEGRSRCAVIGVAFRMIRKSAGDVSREAAR